MAKTLDLPWGNKEKLSLNLPAGWTVDGQLEPASLPGVGDPCAETRRALSQPTGAPRLSELARGKNQVALVIDDGSRPTPIRQVLPAVLEELLAAGISPQQIYLVPALGVHRAMSQPEVE